MMPIAPLPGGVEIATIVSLECMGIEQFGDVSVQGYYSRAQQPNKPATQSPNHPIRDYQKLQAG
jgi:hypothetical protein